MEKSNLRQSTFSRKTKETQIKITLDLDGTGLSEISTGIGFLDHMLTALAKHGHFDLSVVCKGDLEVDGHHTVEDIGICLGKVFNQCIEGGAGITRYGDACIPMDEALVHVILDICGRGYLVHNLDLPQWRVGTLDSCLVPEFFNAFSYNAGVTLHIRQLAGNNTHHIVEAGFKALAHALRQAVTVDRSIKGILSTKGDLDL